MEPVRYRYSVVSFIDLPYKEIKWYICVPNSWVRSRITRERIVVAYPTESADITRKRVKKRQKYAPEWNEYTALLRYETDYFDDAEIFIQSKSESNKATSNRGVILPTTSSSERKRRSSRRKDSSNAKMKPQMSVAPFKGDEQSMMKLTIRCTTSPQPVRRHSTNRQKTKKALNITNRFECINENYSEELQSHEIPAERLNRESFGDVDNERNPADGINQSVNPRKITEQEFINNFCDLMRNFNTICTDTRSMIKNLNDTVIKSEETLDNVLRSVNNYSKSNTNNTAGGKTASKYQNRKDDDDYDSDVASNSVDDNDDDSTDDVDTNDDDVTENNTPKKRNPYIRTFVLPPDYDPNDSKWTLKHRCYRPGLVEIMPQSGVFVDAIQFANCKRVSTDCKTLARKLLLEIFSRNALSVCSMTGHRSNAFAADGGEVRPGLDEYARTLLFTFVEEYGREKGWNIFENLSVVNSVRSKIQEMRAKFGKTK